MGARGGNTRRMLFSSERPVIATRGRGGRGTGDLGGALTSQVPHKPPAVQRTDEKVGPERACPEPSAAGRHSMANPQTRFPVHLSRRFCRLAQRAAPLAAPTASRTVSPALPLPVRCPRGLGTPGLHPRLPPSPRTPRPPGPPQLSEHTPRHPRHVHTASRGVSVSVPVYKWGHGSF